PALSKRATFLMWAFGISYGVMIVLAGLLAILFSILGRSGAAGVIVPIGCAAGIAAIAVMVFAIMYLLMLEKFGKAFKEQQVLALQHVQHITNLRPGLGFSGARGFQLVGETPGRVGGELR